MVPPRLASAKIAADRSISGDHQRPLAAGSADSATLSLPTVWEQRAIKSSASLSQPEDSPTADLFAFGIKHTGLFSKMAVRSAVCVGDLVQLLGTSPWSRGLLSRTCPSPGCTVMDKVGRVGSGAPVAAVLLTLISAAQCRRLRAVRVHEHNKPPHRQWDAIHAAAQELSSLKQSRAIQWYPAAQGPPGTSSRHVDSWPRATRKKGLFQTPAAKLLECQKVP